MAVGQTSGVSGQLNEGQQKQTQQQHCFNNQQQQNLQQQHQFNPQLGRQQHLPLNINPMNPMNRNPPQNRNNSAPIHVAHGWQLPSSQPLSAGIVPGSLNPMVSGSTQFVTSPPNASAPQRQQPNKRLSIRTPTVITSSTGLVADQGTANPMMFDIPPTPTANQNPHVQQQHHQQFQHQHHQQQQQQYHQLRRQASQPIINYNQHQMMQHQFHQQLQHHDPSAEVHQLKLQIQQMQLHINQLLENQRFMSSQILNLASALPNPNSSTPNSTNILTPITTPLEATSPRVAAGGKRKLEDDITLTTGADLSEADHILNELLSFEAV
ncbi:hypothetical protein BDR26DRAFT_863478 [Obelidium mucronatum]|nr:hypothetical protein BDR26DRAFT_863478 [Obelidium mucronatum]